MKEWRFRNSKVRGDEVSHKNVNNYAKQAEQARELFLKWDQSKVKLRVGITADDNFLYVDFFNEHFKVNRLDGEVLRCGEIDEKADYNPVMIIYDVLCNSKSGATLSGEWSQVENLSPHSNFGSKDDSLYSPSGKYFSGKVELLRKACENLGGFDTGKSDAGFMFNVFPFLPMIFQFWEGDEEFSPRVVFLFDKKTLEFCCFESAWFIAAHLVELIRTEMDAEFSMGFYGR